MINNLLDFPCPELYLEEEVDSIEQDPALVAEARPRSWLRQYYGYILSFLVGVTAMVLALVFGEGVREFENYGYVGVFLMGIIGSAAPVWPMPGAWAAFIAAGLGWSIVWVGLAAGIGEAIGELTYYFLGYSGRPLFGEGKWYRRVMDWMRRHGSITIFLAAAIPNFIIRLADFSAGVLRYPVWKFFLFCWAGKTVKSFGFALAGAGLFAWLTSLF